MSKPQTAQYSGIYSLPVSTTDGVFMATYSEKGLCRLNFPGGPHANRAPSSTIPKPVENWHKLTTAALKAVFAGNAPRVLPPFDLSAGTEFQQRVWRQMGKIRCGQTMSYGEIAHAIGNAGAVRAVGGACGANPIPVLVPCHRVLAAHRRLGGFSSGLAWKRKLLAREHLIVDAGQVCEATAAKKPVQLALV